MSFGNPLKQEKIREEIYQIVFEAETKAGRLFDIVLLIAISLSVLVVALESVESIAKSYMTALLVIEWVFTVFFTVEFLLRIYCVKHPWRYVFSFYGIVDILAILPAYLSIFIDGGQSLLVIRGFRLLRVFRLLKLGRYVGEAEVLLKAVKASRYKISVFLITVLSMATTVGAMMYLIEGAESGFTSIPKSVYWAIVTMTTVGYGDIAPQTVLGQFLASIIMIMGYGILAVPTGIVSVELAEANKTKPFNTRVCSECMLEGHASDARYCRKCGESLPQSTE